MIHTPIRQTFFNTPPKNNDTNNSTSNKDYTVLIAAILAATAFKLIEYLFRVLYPAKSTNLKNRVQTKKAYRGHRNTSATSKENSSFRSKISQTNRESKSSSGNSYKSKLKTSSHNSNFYKENENNLNTEPKDLLQKKIKNIENDFQRYVSALPYILSMELKKLKGNGLYLQHFISSAFRNNPHVVLYAMIHSKDFEALKFASAGLLNDETFAIKVVSLQGNLIRHFPDKIKNNLNVVRAAVSTDFDYIKSLSNEPDPFKTYNFLMNFEPSYNFFLNSMKSDFSQIKKQKKLIKLIENTFLDTVGFIPSKNPFSSQFDPSPKNCNADQTPASNQSHFQTEESEYSKQKKSEVSNLIDQINNAANSEKGKSLLLKNTIESKYTIKNILCDMLGISNRFDDTQIKKAFNKAVLKIHPDKCLNNPDAAEAFKILSRVKNMYF